MDLSAPQFGVFGEKISVSPHVPEVFVLTTKDVGSAGVGTAVVTHPETYTDRQPQNIVMRYRAAGVSVPAR